MKTNRKIKNKGWQIVFVFVVLVLQLFHVESVLALEEDSIVKELEESVDLEEIKEEFVVLDVTREDIWNCYSENMEFSLGKVMIQDKINESIQVGDILNQIRVEALKIEYTISDIYIIDNFGNILTSTDEITGEDKIIFLGEDYIDSYQIEIFGDYTKNGIVNVEDVDQVLENYITDSKNVTMEEISYIGYVVKNNTYEVPTVSITEPLQNKLEVESNDIYIEEEVMIEYTIEGIKANQMNMIEATIEYDKTSLELIDIYFLGKKIEKGIVQDQYFICLLEETEEISLFVFLFKANNGGTHQVRLHNIKVVSNGTLLALDSSSASIEFFVQEYGKGGDVLESVVSPGTEEVLQSQMSNIVSSSVIPSSASQNTLNILEQSVIQATEIHLSNDNYIKNLTIKGYNISFDKNQNVYELEIENNVDQLVFDVELSNDNANYFITGNDRFKQGKNNVVLTVQAEDGSTRDYVITVNKAQAMEVENETQKQAIKEVLSMFVLAILILSIICCLYLFIKKEDR